MQHFFTAQNMRKFVPILVILLLLVTVVACFGPKGANTLGDGKMDAVEAATVRVAVGLAFSAQPETIAPAYAVATAVLAVLADTKEPVPASVIDRVIGAQLDDLNLDSATRQSFNDLVLLIQAKILEQLGAGPEISNKVVVIRDIVAIVRETAAARLGTVAQATDR